MKVLSAWTRHSADGTPSGHIHGVNARNGKALCGRGHAGVFAPPTPFPPRPWSFLENAHVLHEDACRTCLEVLS